MSRCMGNFSAHFLIRKKLFNSKCTQLHVTKDFAVAEKKLHLTVSGRKYDPGKKASKRKRTSDVKLQIQNHPLHKTSPSLNSNHKMSPSLNSNHKMSPSLNSSHKMSPSLSSSKTCPQLNNKKTKLLIH